MGNIFMIPFDVIFLLIDNIDLETVTIVLGFKSYEGATQWHKTMETGASKGLGSFSQALEALQDWAYLAILTPKPVKRKRKKSLIKRFVGFFKIFSQGKNKP